MKWSLLELNKYKDRPYEFSERLDVKASLMQRESSLLDVSPVTVTGSIVLTNNEYLLSYTAEVTLTLPSSRSLAPVELPLELMVNEVMMTVDAFKERPEHLADEEVIILESSTIDLVESVEDNILLAIPMQVLSEEEKQNPVLPKGNDWEVISEDDYVQQQQAAPKLDPRLAKLSELFQAEDNE